MVLLVGRRVPGPGAEGGQRVECGADFERGEGCGEEDIAKAVFGLGAGLQRGLREVPVEKHGVAARHEEGGDEAGVSLDGDRGVEVLEVFGLNLAFAGFHAGAEVVQRDVLTVHLYAAAEDEAVDFVDFVANKREGDIRPAVVRRGVLLPLGTAKFEYIVVHVEW